MRLVEVHARVAGDVVDAVLPGRVAVESPLYARDLLKITSRNPLAFEREPSATRTSRTLQAVNGKSLRASSRMWEEHPSLFRMSQVCKGVASQDRVVQRSLKIITALAADSSTPVYAAGGEVGCRPAGVGQHG